jgi:hypothetical protein
MMRSLTAPAPRSRSRDFTQDLKRPKRTARVVWEPKSAAAPSRPPPLVSAPQEPAFPRDQRAPTQRPPPLHAPLQLASAARPTAAALASSNHHAPPAPSHHHAQHSLQPRPHAAPQPSQLPRQPPPQPSHHLHSHRSGSQWDSGPAAPSAAPHHAPRSRPGDWGAGGPAPLPASRSVSWTPSSRSGGGPTPLLVAPLLPPLAAPPAPPAPRFECPDCKRVSKAPHCLDCDVSALAALGRQDLDKTYLAEFCAKDALTSKVFDLQRAVEQLKQQWLARDLDDAVPLMRLNWHRHELRWTDEKLAQLQRAKNQEFG